MLVTVADLVSASDQNALFFAVLTKILRRSALVALTRDWISRRVFSREWPARLDLVSFTARGAGHELEQKCVQERCNIMGKTRTLIEAECVLVPVCIPRGNSRQHRL